MVSGKSNQNISCNKSILPSHWWLLFHSKLSFVPDNSRIIISNLIKINVFLLPGQFWATLGGALSVPRHYSFITHAYFYLEVASSLSASDRAQSQGPWQGIYSLKDDKMCFVVYTWIEYARRIIVMNTEFPVNFYSVLCNRGSNFWTLISLLSSNFQI